MMENWHKKYIELMFGPQHTIATMEDAANLKFAHMPKYLYKYRMFTDNHIQALEDGVLYSSPPSKFNDLTDTNLVITKEAKKKVEQRTYDSLRGLYGLPEATVTSSEGFIRIAEEFFREKSNSKAGMPENLLRWIQSVLDKEQEKIMDNYRNESRDRYNVCSFSAANDIDLMWAHYSYNHTGFCIGYDFKSLGVTDDDVQLMFPVIYDSDGRVFINDIDEVDPSFLMYGTTMKKESWSYEQEWRRLYLGGNSAPQPMPKPAAIYLGAKADKEHEDWMKYFCIKKKIPLYRMFYDAELNTLVPTPYVDNFCNE